MRTSSGSDYGQAWGHAGMVSGFTSVVRYYPGYDLAVAVMVNSADAGGGVPRELTSWRVTGRIAFVMRSEWKLKELRSSRSRSLEKTAPLADLASFDVVTVAGLGTMSGDVPAPSRWPRRGCSTLHRPGRDGEDGTEVAEVVVSQLARVALVPGGG